MSSEFFKRLHKQVETKDQDRERCLADSRLIIQKSKKAIYAIHRDALKEAKTYISDAKKNIEGIRKYKYFHPIFDAALQEYSEAVSYLSYVETNALPDYDKLDVDAENVLGGLSDLTGELSRRAVFSVVNEQFSEIEKIKDFVEVIYKEFLNFDLRNGELRKKSDAIKWNLKRIEEIQYDLKLRGKI